MDPALGSQYVDGADWTYLDPLLERGLLPNLAALVAQGRRGVLETLHPPLSPLVWNTMMTGVSPLQHGILDFTRFNPATGAKEPITSDERRWPAVWNEATLAGKSSATLGLWATYPAEAVRGLMVSDRLFTFLYQESTPPPGVVFPPQREAWARNIVAQVEGEIGLDDLRSYLPWLEAAAYQQALTVKEPYGHPVSALRRILVETEIYRRLALATLDEDAADLTVVYLRGTDTIGHVFAAYAPPRLETVSQEDFRRYKEVPERYFQAVDALLGELRQRAEALGAVLVLASDHGFHWREGRPLELSSFAGTTAARWHRKEGIYLLWGPGIDRDSETPAADSQAQVAQVAPTLLALLGLPPAIGMELGPLPGVSFGDRKARDYRPYFQPGSGAAPGPASAADEELAKLQALGYLGTSTGEKARPAADGRYESRTAGSFNNAGLLWLAAGRKNEAAEAFEAAIERDPKLASALWNLSDLLFARRQLERSDRLLLAAVAQNLPQGVEMIIGRAIAYQRSGDGDRALRLMNGAVQARPEEAELWLFRGRYRIDHEDCAGALKDFQQATSLAPESPAAHASTGLAHLCLEDPSAAAQAFQRSLSLNPDQPRLRQMLGQLAG